MYILMHLDAVLMFLMQRDIEVVGLRRSRNHHTTGILIQYLCYTMHLHEFFVLICIRICMNLYVCVTYVFYGGLRRRGDLAHHMYLHLSLYLICSVFVLIVFSLFLKLRRRGDQTHHFCMFFYGWLRKKAIRHTICIAYCIRMYLSLCGRIRDTTCII